MARMVSAIEATVSQAKRLRLEIRRITANADSSKPLPLIGHATILCKNSTHCIVLRPAQEGLRARSVIIDYLLNQS